MDDGVASAQSIKAIAVILGSAYLLPGCGIGLLLELFNLHRVVLCEEQSLATVWLAVRCALVMVTLLLSSWGLNWKYYCDGSFFSFFLRM